ncbi:MAG: hypothetical protein AAB375_02570 [Patescibacteria group bacterium]
MTDPTVIPWSVVWYGLMVVCCGTMLAWHGVGQRRPSRVAGFGGLCVVLGVTVMLGVALINGAVMIVKAFGVVTQQAVATAQPQVSKGAPR